jgi:hypothetical protein
MTRRERQRGAAILILAILLPVLLGALGLVVDNGYKFALRREMQSAADATALAAAQEWRNQNYSGYQTAALHDADLNNFDSSDVKINVPPTQGKYQGNSKYVEVVIKQQSPLFFMGVLTSDPGDVSARAVAGLVPEDACVYVLDPHVSGAFTAGGTTDVTIHDCGILVNSDSDTAAVTNGSAAVTATSFGVNGNYSGTGFYPTPQTDVYPVDDPLADLPPPPIGSCIANKLMITTETWLVPGAYCGGIQILSGGTVHMSPGIYVMYGGGLSVAGGAGVEGSGIMIYNTGESSGQYKYDDIVFTGSSQTNLSAPTSGTYKGILMFQDRNFSGNLNKLYAGTSDGTLEGVLYFPNGNVKFTGTSTAVTQKMAIIGRTVEFAGSAQLQSFDVASDMIPPAFVVARVVE